jgi:hypothetical protein
MNRDETISHLEKCIADVIHQLECIKSELVDIKTQA